MTMLELVARIMVVIGFIFIIVGFIIFILLLKYKFNLWQTRKVKHDDNAQDKRSNNMDNKIIEICPVCHSHDIYQQLGNGMSGDEFIIYGTGSHCNNCGVKFVFNTPHLQQDIDKERTYLINLKHRFIGKGRVDIC